VADVNLTLKANNSDYVNKMLQSQHAAQKVYDTTERGTKREKGLIQDIEDELSKLEKARKKAYSIQDIEKYNKKIAEAKKDLKEYEKIGVEAHEKVAKSGNKLKAVYVGIVAAIASVAASFRILKNAVIESEIGLNRYNIVLAVTKQLLYDIIHRTPLKEWKKNMEEAANIQSLLNQLRRIERDSLKEIAEYQVLYRQHLVDAVDQTRTLTERLKSYDYALTAHKKAINEENEITAKKLALVKEALLEAPGTEALLEEESRLTLKLIEIEEKRYSGIQRITSMRSGIINAIKKQLEELYLIELKLLNKPDEAAGSLMGLILFGEDDVEIIKNVIEFRRNLKKELGKLAKSSEEWYKQGKKDIETLKDAEKKVANERIENFEQAGDAVLDYISIVDELAQREINEAERKRELLDIRISETQQALETETQLYEAGYASNVTAKKQEIERLKILREKALLDEEKARKKEHTLKVVQLFAEQAVAVAKIIMSAEVAKMEAWAIIANPTTAIPGFALLASIRVSEMISLAAVAAAAIAASLSKFAKGGWTGDGSGRDETGERVAGVVHEKEFVIKRGPANKFRDVLEAINKDDKELILTRFNQLAPELVGGTSVNNISVENSGPNNRLDKINTQLHYLNKKLEPKKQVREQVMDNGNELVYQRGNTIRTVRK